jgi:formylmethanofuran dehydrogenase subunit E-like metal-binding protein
MDDRTQPLDIYDDFELIDKYRFDRQSIMMICDMLQDDLESSTFRNHVCIGNNAILVSFNYTYCIYPQSTCHQMVRL